MRNIRLISLDKKQAIKMKITIADDRKPWMIEEDKRMACMTRCSQYKKCSSFLGFDCKKLGGNEIPKLSRRMGKK